MLYFFSGFLNKILPQSRQHCDHIASITKLNQHDETFQYRKFPLIQNMITTNSGRGSANSNHIGNDHVVRARSYVAIHLKVNSEARIKLSSRT